MAESRKLPITKQPSFNAMPTSVALFSFDELSDEVQEKVIAAVCHQDLYDGWYGPIYEDAENVGLQIREFDLYRGTIRGEMSKSLPEVYKRIRNNYGVTTEIFKTARKFHNIYITTFVKWCKVQIQLFPPDDFTSPWKRTEMFEEFNAEDEAYEIELDFKRALLEEYRIILQKEYDYLTSRKKVVEDLLESDYLFTKNGQQVDY